MNMSRTLFMDRKNNCERWSIPDFGESVDLTGDPGLRVTVKTGQNHRPGYDEGFESGRREGLESGRQEVAAQTQLLEQLMCSLTRPFDELDREVEVELVELTLAIVRKLVHVEIKSSPELIASVVNETIALLPGTSRDIQLHLHPEDAQLLEELMPGTARDNNWEIIGDVSLQRGGCVVRTRASQIDATVGARLENVIAALLNAENSQEMTE